jgi:hypothetical protein
VMMARVTTPTISTCATRTAVKAPFNANANVPARSNVNSTEGSAATPRVYRMHRPRPAWDAPLLPQQPSSDEVHVES